MLPLRIIAIADGAALCASRTDRGLQHERGRLERLSCRCGTDPANMIEPTRRLIPITTDTHGVDIDLVYATDRNLTGKPIYRGTHCLLLEPAEAALRRAVAIARRAGLALRIFDAYRPPRAQQILWDFLPDPTYIADVKTGSNHSRGTAIDLTLLDASGSVLDMGTGFDDMTVASAHFAADLPETVQRNRLLLLGMMQAAGFTHIPSEWWHYELPGSRTLPLVDDGANGAPMLM